jgi:large subunit ribosomal protein L27
MFPSFTGLLSSNLKPISIFHQIIRNATKKAGGSTKNGRDSPGQRLGVKKFGGEHVIPGNIIIRQRGKTYHIGGNVKLGRDFTIYSVSEGFVYFQYDKKKKHQVVSVVPENPYLPKLQQQQQQQEEVQTNACITEQLLYIKLLALSHLDV